MIVESSFFGLKRAAYANRIGVCRVSLQHEIVKKVIVFSREGQIVVTECEEDLEEGQFVMVHDENPN